MKLLKRALASTMTCAMVCALASGSAAAQDREALRRTQAEVYERMLAAPTDAALMIEYARASIALEDYEAAAATLERALIFEPGEPITQMELGVAYFRLGSYGLAEFHFNEARAGGLPAERDANAALYLAEIAERTQTSRLSGSVSAGLIASSNANLGPENDVISFFGIPATLAPGGTSQSDVGARATASLRHVYDFGGPTTDALITDLSAYSVRYFDENAGDIDYASVTTGPSLSVDDSAFGPKVRPFVTLGHARVSNDPFYTEFGGGVEGSAPISETLTGFGRISLLRRDFRSGLGDFDSVIVGTDLGGAMRVSPRLTLRAAAFAEAEFAEAEEQDHQEFGLRGAASYSYPHGIQGLDGLWTLTGHARYAHRTFDEAVTAVDPNVKRDDDEFRIGVAHLFRIQDGFGVRVDADYFDRQSDIANFELDNFTVGVSAHYEF